MNALVEKSESVIEHRKTAIYQSNLNLIISNPPSEPPSVRPYPKKKSIKLANQNPATSNTALTLCKG